MFIVTNPVRFIVNYTQGDTDASDRGDSELFRVQNDTVTRYAYGEWEHVEISITDLSWSY